MTRNCCVDGVLEYAQAWEVETILGSMFYYIISSFDFYKDVMIVSFRRYHAFLTD